MSYIVTGGLGFIGRALVQILNRAGCTDITIVDDLTRDDLLDRTRGISFRDLIDVSEGIEGIKICYQTQGVFHLGATSDARCTDVSLLHRNNTLFSKKIRAKCYENNVPLVYASSAAVYGNGTSHPGMSFQEDRKCEEPNSLYGLSKAIFDWSNRDLSLPNIPCIGLRYFNVYGSDEIVSKVLRTRSILSRFCQDAVEKGAVFPFEGSENFHRDFIHVSDAVNITIWAMSSINKSGSTILNCGTGQTTNIGLLAQMVADVAEARVTPIPFPNSIDPRTYQKFTVANVDRLRESGYTKEMVAVRDGIEIILKEIRDRCS